MTDARSPADLPLGLIGENATPIWGMTNAERARRMVAEALRGGASVADGDVSSQVYEFLARPRPCLFLDAHATDWRGNPDYRFWTLGDVVDDIAAIPAALDAAPARHPLYAAAQRAAVAESVGGDPAGAAERGARAIIAFLRRDHGDTA